MVKSNGQRIHFYIICVLATTSAVATTALIMYEILPVYLSFLNVLVPMMMIVGYASCYKMEARIEKKVTSGGYLNPTIKVEDTEKLEKKDTPYTVLP